MNRPIDRRAPFPRRAKTRSRRLIVSQDALGLALPFWFLAVVTAVALIVGRNTAGDDGGARDVAVGIGFYGGLIGLYLLGPYAVGYVAARLIVLVSGPKAAAMLGYAGIVTSLVIAIFVNKWAAIALGAVPSAGAIVSAASYASGAAIGGPTLTTNSLND